MLIQRGFTTDGTGEKLTPFPSGGGSTADTDDQQAVEVPYDNSGSGLTANDVQEAIDELAAQVSACCDDMGGGISTGELGESGAGKQDQVTPDFDRLDVTEWSWDNQGGATDTQNADGSASLSAPAGVSFNVRVRYKSAPGATPWTKTAYCSFLQIAEAQKYGGIGFRQSSDGKLSLLALDGVRVLHVYDCNSSTSFSGEAANKTIPGHGPIHLQITDNGTNRLYEWSTSGGYDFALLYSVGRTTFLTANQVCRFATEHANTLKSVNTTHSWSPP